MAVSNILKAKANNKESGRLTWLPAGPRWLLVVMEITLKNLQHKVPIPRQKVLKTARAALRKLGKNSKNSDRHNFLLKKFVPVTIFLSIVFVGTKRMRSVNKKYLGHDDVTDVLTFDLGDNIAEIMICPQIACANAKVHQTSTEREIVLYVIHGILHLAGFDDQKPKDILLMRRMEKALL